MALSAGTKLGAFEVRSLLGAGGMGEVYRALDGKLGREVAIKVLPEAYKSDEERMARFEREARALAQLDHPAIGAIFDFVKDGPFPFIVMQLVEGETLAQRVQRGPLPLRSALAYFEHVASALAFAHDRNIIHRDLKPANIKITPDEQAKILDFGIAKILEPGTSPHEAVTEVLSGNAHTTKHGHLIGTPAYMSPEQARGKTLDKRTDVWSFGCCLFECLSGKPPFDGDTTTDALVAVLEAEPDWSTLPAETPEAVRVLLRRCLEKDTKDRLRDMSDGALEIRDALRGSGSGRRSDVDRTVALRAPAVASVPVRRLSIMLDPNAPVSPPREYLDPAVAISRDGTQLVYVAVIDGVRRLLVRPLDQLETRALAGTEHAIRPTFSPDGQWICYFTIPDGHLRKVSIHGGAPVTLAEVSHPMGVDWAGETIYYISGMPSELLRIPDTGGEPELLPLPEEGTGGFICGSPSVVPEERGLLYGAAYAPDLNLIRVMLLDFATRKTTVLVESALRPAYVRTGHVLFTQRGRVMALPFDAAAMRATGAPILVPESRIAAPQWPAVQFDVADDGTLVYVPTVHESDFRQTRTLVWIDREGKEEPVAQPAKSYECARIAPDGERAAVSVKGDIWIIDLAKGTNARFTFDQANNEYPVWSPDGQVLVFSTSHDGRHALCRKRLDGTGEPTILELSPNVHHPHGWSPDGQHIVLVEYSTKQNVHISLCSPDGSGGLRLWSDPGAFERAPSLSRDGRFIAYVGGETGREEVYVQPFPDRGGKWQISFDGGVEPEWSPDGRELYYREGDTLMAVSIQTEPKFSASEPRRLFSWNYFAPAIRAFTYHVAADGSRFLMIKQTDAPAAAPPASEIVVVQNWFAELHRLTPSHRRAKTPTDMG
ncbi:MAG: serine/threonine-protein kinase [Candidatus Hydrogenedentes bacterium]|nr:serine/threonine-protein kinase [Candidatus Hydrogenedentota bacterium]